VNKVPITVNGAESLQTELKQLKGTDRPKVIEAIAEARAHGDLKENAEYHAAREEQSFLEAKIAKYETVLSSSQIIDVKTLPQNGKVVFGTTVNIYDLDTNVEVKYQIVGDIESDIDQNKISISSPIARALIGKEVGDVAEIQVPSGKREVEILSIDY